MQKRKTKIFTPEMDLLLLQIYSATPNSEIYRQTGWTPADMKYPIKRLGLKKSIAAKQVAAGKIKWTEEMKLFLRENCNNMTNRELAKALNLKLTVVRNEIKYLGLNRMKLQYWTEDETKFLLENYKVLGDTEIATQLAEVYPRSDRPWDKKSVRKKRVTLSLERTREEWKAIVKRHVLPGGAADTIRINSASTNLADGWVANIITRDKDLKTAILASPAILNLKRAQIQLNRSIKEVANAKK